MRVCFKKHTTPKNAAVEPSLLLRVSCLRQLINVCQFCVVEDCADPLQGVRLPDPFQLHLVKRIQNVGSKTESERPSGHQKRPDSSQRRRSPC